MKPTYSTTNGERLTSSQIETRMTYSKGVLLQNQLDDKGYNFCQTCKRNDCFPITCAHVISVKEAKEKGMAELCWAIDNMVIEGIPCHQKRDKTNVQFNDTTIHY